MKKWFAVFLLFLAACSSQGVPDTSVSGSLETDDSVNIAYSYYSGGPRGIILLHMLNRNRNDWNEFARELQTLGFSVISIDLRGHGQSSGNWKSFGSDEFNAMVFDVKAAKEVLAANGATNFGIIGASIGANIALKYSDPDVSAVVLLSPGLEYRDVDIESDAEQFNTPVLIVASSEDQYSATSSEKIEKLLPGDKKLIMLNDAGHGTSMFVKPELSQEIINWIQRRLA